MCKRHSPFVTIMVSVMLPCSKTRPIALMIVGVVIMSAPALSKISPPVLKTARSVRITFVQLHMKLYPIALKTVRSARITFVQSPMKLFTIVWQIVTSAGTESAVLLMKILVPVPMIAVSAPMVHVVFLKQLLTVLKIVLTEQPRPRLLALQISPLCEWMLIFKEINADFQTIFIPI